MHCTEYTVSTKHSAIINKSATNYGDNKEGVKQGI